MAIGKFSVVQLLSGGPHMTVVGVIGDTENAKIVDFAYKQSGYKDGDLICEWFDDKNLAQSKVFHAGALKEVGAK